MAAESVRIPSGTVDGIANHGVANRGEMHPDLMRSPGEGVGRDQGSGSVVSFHLEFGARISPAFC